LSSASAFSGFTTYSYLQSSFPSSSSSSITLQIDLFLSPVYWACIIEHSNGFWHGYDVSFCFSSSVFKAVYSSFCLVSSAVYSSKTVFLLCNKPSTISHSSHSSLVYSGTEAETSPKNIKYNLKWFLD